MSQEYQYAYQQAHVPASIIDGRHCQSFGQFYAPLPGMPYNYAQQPPVWEPSTSMQGQPWTPYSQQVYGDPGRVLQPPATIPGSATGFAAWFDFSNSGYLKGLLVGAGLALLATNPAVQRLLISGGIKLWSTFQGGIEEVKEQVRDIQAEMSQKKE